MYFTFNIQLPAFIPLNDIHCNPFVGAQWLSGRVLDSRPRAAGSSLTGVTALWSLSKTHLSLVQPRKTRPCLTERVLIGRKESNRTNKQK